MTTDSQVKIVEAIRRQKVIAETARREAAKSSDQNDYHHAFGIENALIMAVDLSLAASRRSNSVVIMIEYLEMSRDTARTKRMATPSFTEDYYYNLGVEDGFHVAIEAARNESKEQAGMTVEEAIEAASEYTRKVMIEGLSGRNSHRRVWRDDEGRPFVRINRCPRYICGYAVLLDDPLVIEFHTSSNPADCE